MSTDVGPGDLAAVLERARTLGFLGPGPVGRHIEQADAFVAAVGPPPRRLLDLGSGGGVPGLVLAARWPTTEVVLVDTKHRRVAFLDAAVRELGWGDRVTVLPGRAEALARSPGHRHQFDVVTARSFGPPAVTAECGAPFLRIGGVLLVAEPPAGEADRWPPAGLAGLGLADRGVASTGGGTVRRLVAERLCDERFPRRVGVPGKRPLF